MQFLLRIIQTPTEIVDGPADRLPVGIGIVGAGERLEAIARRVPGIDRAATGDAVAGRADVDRDMVHAHDIAGAQDLFPALDAVGDMVQLARLRETAERDVVAFVRARQEHHRHGGAVLEIGRLAETEAEHLGEQFQRSFKIGAVKQCVVHPHRGDAAFGLIGPGRWVEKPLGIDQMFFLGKKIEDMAARCRKADALARAKQLARRNALHRDAEFLEINLELVERRIVEDAEREMVDPGGISLTQHQTEQVALIPGLEIDPALGIATGLDQAENSTVVMNRLVHVQHADLGMGGSRNASKGHDCLSL